MPEEWSLGNNNNKNNKVDALHEQQPNDLVYRLQEQVEEQRKEIDRLKLYSAILETKFQQMGFDEMDWACENDQRGGDKHDDVVTERVLSVESFMNIQETRLATHTKLKSTCFNKDISENPVKLMCSSFKAGSFKTKYVPSLLERPLEPSSIVPGGIFNHYAHTYHWFDEVYLDYPNIGPSFGSSWGDFNNDGYPDLYVNNHYWAPSLYLNLKNGTFKNIVFDVIPTLNETKKHFLDKHGGAWADFDKDGHLDLFEVTGAKYGTAAIPNNLYRNINGTLVDEATIRNVEYPYARARTISWLDYNNDGHLDAFIATQMRNDGKGKPVLLYQHPSNNTFMDVNQDVGMQVDSNVMFAKMLDIDNDGVLELFIVAFTFPFKVYHTSSTPFEDVTNQLFNINHTKMQEHYKEVKEAHADASSWLPPHPSTGVYAIISDLAFGDLDGNGWQDIIIARNFFGECIIDVFYNQGYTNTSKNKLEWDIVELHRIKGVSCGSLVVADFDNNMALDIFLVTYASYSNSPNVLLVNTGEGRKFMIKEDGGGAAGSTFGKGESVSVADYDLDGKLDLFITNGKGSPPFDIGPFQLFKNNNAFPRNWIQVDIVGITENPHGFGGRVFLKACGTTQFRDIDNGVHFIAQNSFRVHFGLGACKRINELKVWWPRSKIFQTELDVAINQVFVFVENISIKQQRLH
ncbi:hypothetical protein SAMD00019534_001140 [Acytostelium subglobosum LB1]|uniref:hypothetical protein n=1 Tax=Acytostelium subglobosum LB1 TaxID=1410327 RepID=UPI000644EDBD|nr:hypothetical protein SAMD00019534_001140 [Acytostelium subglobosum LB1]GAM16939.1 hypothetical protein SAMD00019534_001140 [Acytostelium subglobosum LB1]|eukprot:XP_012759001.1 hypothetical protein SAMD00019534_001140 [Acytostelium subglobosum LB1]